MNRVWLGFILCIFAIRAFAQSTTGAPAPNVTKPLTMQHLAGIKDKSSEQPFTVKTTNGNTVAEIHKIIVDSQSSQPRFAVLHLYDNVDEHRPFTAVPWEMLTIENPTRDIVIRTSVAHLRKAPKSNADNLPTKVEGNWGQEYYTFYNVQANTEARGGSGMLPSGTIKGSGGNMPEAQDAGKASRVFLWSAAGVAVLVVLLLVFNRRRAIE
jgi:hypothetical protein